MKIAVEEWELYNNGILLCKWFDTETDTQEEIEAYIKEVKKKAGLNADDIEAFIADFEGETLGEDLSDASIYEAYEIQEKIDTLDEHSIAAVKLIIENDIYSDIDDAIGHAEDMIYTGCSSMEEVAKNYIDEAGALQCLPEELRYYFDYEALARDMEINGSFYEDENGNIWEYIG